MAAEGYYKKMALWKWIVIYVVLGSIVYYLIYVYYIKKNNLYNSNPSNTSAQTSPLGY